MPPLANGMTITKKRKREPLHPIANKTRESLQNEEDPQASILLLETQVLESRKHYNNIAILIATLRGQDVLTERLFVAVSLCRIFSRLLIGGRMTKTKVTLENESIVLQWLKDRYAEYTDVLLAILREGSPENQNTALTLLMRLLKDEGTHMSSTEDYTWSSGLFPCILRVLIESVAGEEVMELFAKKYLQQYDDVRFHTFTTSADIISSQHPPNLIDTVSKNSIDILSAVEAPPKSTEDICNFYLPSPKRPKHPLLSLQCHKRAGQSAWLALLRTGPPSTHRKTILSLISPKIAPWFLKVELLMDFLTDSYDTGGSTSLLALSGLFYLIQEKNLDYPLFYQKLYSLLDANILHSRHRSRFLRLLDIFLASTHLPAALVASFIKRLSRLLLHGPPAGIVAIIPWIYNLLKRHPTCTFMIHRLTHSENMKRKLDEEGMDDPFNMEEKDPMRTNAIESSLWEIQMLQSHYHPNVATLAKIISEQFTKQGYNLEDFLDHSYASMLDVELSKDLKKTPIIEYEIPKRIFSKHEADSPLHDSLLVRLWDFS